MIFIKMNTSIEGKSFSLYCRKGFTNLPPSNNSILNTIIFNFVIKGFAQATIEKELVPKKAKIRKSSYLNIGDRIQGDIISGFSVKPISKETLIHRGSHRAKSIITKKFSFAKIDREWRAISLKKVTGVI